MLIKCWQKRSLHSLEFDELINLIMLFQGSLFKFLKIFSIIFPRNVGWEKVGLYGKKNGQLGLAVIELSLNYDEGKSCLN